jgi:hypothetical protein
VWVRTKNRATARFAEERDGVRRRVRRRKDVAAYTAATIPHQGS